MTFLVFNRAQLSNSYLTTSVTIFSGNERGRIPRLASSSFHQTNILQCLLQYSSRMGWKTGTQLFM